MNNIIAALRVDRPVDLEKLYCGDRLALWQDKGCVYFSLSESAWPLRLDDVLTIFHSLTGFDASPGLVVVWRFSGLSTEVSQLPTLLARWQETGEPPLLSIIDLTLGHSRHFTRGMAAFVEFELAVIFHGPVYSRLAARNLARLARYALMHGGLSQDSCYEATDGSTMRLIWSDDASPENMVTIDLRSIQNGAGSD